VANFPTRGTTRCLWAVHGPRRRRIAVNSHNRCPPHRLALAINRRSRMGSTAISRDCTGACFSHSGSRSLRCASPPRAEYREAQQVCIVTPASASHVFDLRMPLLPSHLPPAMSRRALSPHAHAMRLFTQGPAGFHRHDQFASLTTAATRRSPVRRRHRRLIRERAIQARACRHGLLPWDPGCRLARRRHQVWHWCDMPPAQGRLVNDAG
jgi:hypothetical protein